MPAESLIPLDVARAGQALLAAVDRVRSELADALLVATGNTAATADCIAQFVAELDAASDTARSAIAAEAREEYRLTLAGGERR